MSSKLSFFNIENSCPNEQASAYVEYSTWFEKINLNTLVWQILIVLILYLFRTEIRQLLTVLANVITKIKSIAGVEFLSETTTEKVAENEEKLNEEVKPYMADPSRDPNMVFLNNYINSERDLIELYTKAFKITGGPILDRTDKILRELISEGILKPTILAIHYDIRHARNKIAHGHKVFSNFEEAENYLKAVILYKDMIKEGLNFLNQN